MEITSIIRTEFSPSGFLLPAFGSEGNIFVAKKWPFRKHLIAIGCFIQCDIYENFMDSRRSGVWHFGFPLKLWKWRGGGGFHLLGHRVLNENNSSSRAESHRNKWKRDEREDSDIVFNLWGEKKAINMMDLDRDNCPAVETLFTCCCLPQVIAE